jgi:hypothetical protein
MLGGGLICLLATVLIAVLVARRRQLGLADLRGRLAAVRG